MRLLDYHGNGAYTKQPGDTNTSFGSHHDTSLGTQLRLPE